jgi:hypothetical protein
MGEPVAGSLSLLGTRLGTRLEGLLLGLRRSPMPAEYTVLLPEESPCPRGGCLREGCEACDLPEGV